MTKQPPIPFLFLIWVMSFGCTGPVRAQDNSLVQIIADVQPKIVKIYGSGGFRGLENYQSAIVISPDGLLLTAWSYVLESEKIIATMNDGQRFEAQLVGYDPRIEIAVLKIDADGLPSFNLEAGVLPRPGTRVLAFSNLYRVATGNEPASVLQGIVSSRTQARTRRGALETDYDGDILILDAMTNNPGAAGGGVTDWQGNLLGMIAKEQRESDSGSWLNFAIPIDEFRNSVLDIRAGKMIVEREDSAENLQRLPTEPMTMELLGMRMIPNVVARTPPFVDGVLPDGPAAKSGLLSDDLIVEVNGKMTPSLAAVLTQFEKTDRDATLTLTIQRNREFRQIKIQLNR